ncbi:MAG: flagellar M-ring protein FliF C-terminal domain-containing protein, partial [Caulobacteraceae bacterium]
IPGGATASPNPTGSSGSENTGTESTTNYEISKTTTTQVQPPGTIKRLSVAVAVDGTTAPGKHGKPGAYTPVSAEEMQRLTDLVKATMGYSAARGDQVEVVNVRFPQAADDQGVAATSPLTGFDKYDIMRILELAILAAVGALIVFFVLRPLIQSAAAGVGAAGGALIPFRGGGGAPAQFAVAQGAGQTPALDASGQALALPGPDFEQKIDIARIEGQVKASSVKRVSEFVDKHPEESVSILRTWLHESA